MPDYQNLDQPAASGLGGRTAVRTVCFAAAVGLAMLTNLRANADPWVQRPVLKWPQRVVLAVPDFIAPSPEDAGSAHMLSQIIADDLSQNGVFEPIDRLALLDRKVSVDELPQFADWRATRTEELVVGRVVRRPDGRIQVAFRLWDVASGQQLTGQEYVGSPDDLSRIGHMISSDIYERVTGEKAHF
ncbi:hypothetical protein JQ633_19435 [Bradyrhizobium tropiciagri]|uniref:hypothetical protein n=1 Tax=Bradyrhizobium tropiciagri TaxID=312253 RepID=UPI001BA91BAB|nr:hypothetical protein [Bradyrhizobium tropiciagri]MBR0872543.1 hypothetical protein [Bradyrhizobium tropiciagri]